MDLSTCFVGNWVYGGRCGESDQGESVGTSNAPYTINFSGNYHDLYQSFDQVGDPPGAVVAVESCTAANVCANTLASGPLGFMYGFGCTNAIILANDFSGASYRGIGYSIDGNGNGTLQSASIFTNSLNQGVSFHVELDYAHSFGWFLNQNTYLNGTNVSPFFDPISSAVHISN